MENLQSSSTEKLFSDSDLPPRTGAAARLVEQAKAKPRFKPINRDQLIMRTIDIERLVEADHPVRAIWEMLGLVDLSEFEERIRAVEGRAGQATLSPGYWPVYGYTATRKESVQPENWHGCASTIRPVNG